MPLILLAIPSVLIGYFTIEPLLYGGFFKDAVFINFEHHPAMKEMAHEFHGALAMAVHGLSTLPFWLALAGVVVAFVFYRLKPEIPAAIGRALAPLVKVLENKYYMDWFNEHVLAAGARLLGRGLWKGGDVSFIDGALVNGSARLVGSFSSVVRLVQTGYLYWYALVMILGLIGLMTWQLWPYLGSAVGR
jgi:NADH-quinone oxidoreductase subunit L